MPRLPAVGPFRRVLRAAVVTMAAALAAAAIAGPLAAQQARDADDIAAHPNLFELFLGGTSTEHAIHLSVGLEFEHQLSARWGVGGLADWVLGGEEREALVAPALFAHPAAALRLAVAPGVQRNKESHETLFVTRIGADYEVGVNDRWSISPSVALDLVEGPTSSIFVFGASLGYRF